MKKKYIVTITEVIVSEFEIEAENIKEAQREAEGYVGDGETFRDPNKTETVEWVCEVSAKSGNGYRRTRFI